MTSSLEIVTMRSDQILLILALGIFQSVSSFDCYVGGESSYQPTSCFSCQSVSCLCMSASPVVQYTNSKYDTSQDVLFSSSRNSEGRSQSRLPTYSQTFLEGRQLYSHEHQDNRLQGYTNQFVYQPVPQRLSTPQPRIVFPSQSEPSEPEVIRECWPNPFQAESTGCSVQRYRGEWYNICRCSTELCNAAPGLKTSLSLSWTTSILLTLLLH